MTDGASTRISRDEQLGSIETIEMVPQVGNKEVSGVNSANSQENGAGKPTTHDRFMRTATARTQEVRIPTRTFWRKLKGIHIFMISLNGTLGAGLYGRSGQILELGGPIAVVLSFILTGFLAAAVMQCITELLCIWPIPGALSIFVKVFVDKELGIAVGVAYWFTYSVGFSALIASAAQHLNYWYFGGPKVAASVIYVAMPLILMVFNTCDVGIYGWIEVVTGVLKLVFLGLILLFLLVINVKTGIPETVKNAWNVGRFDQGAASGWTTALMMSLSIAAFSYVGVEIVAATAVEAQWQQPTNTLQNNVTSASEAAAVQSSSTHINEAPTRPASAQNEQEAIGSTILFSALYLPVIVTLAYALGGLLVSLGLDPEDCNLPRLSWIGGGNCSQENKTKLKTSSPFVIIATETKIIDHLGDVFNFFVLFTILSCANTNLYVASRTLAGLTCNLRGEDRVSRCLHWFGRTNERKVPVRAMVLSAFAFAWVPFLQLTDGGLDVSSGIGKFIEILAQFATAGVIVVWACECVAYIQYYRCIRKPAVREALSHTNVHLRQRQRDGEYPYRSRGQPLIAYVALIACLVLLLVCNGVFMWKKPNAFPFLSGYLPIIVFLALWAGLKLYRRAEWSFIELNESTAEEAFAYLNELREGALDPSGAPPQPVLSTFERVFWFIRLQPQNRNHRRLPDNFHAA